MMIQPPSRLLPPIEIGLEYIEILRCLSLNKIKTYKTTTKKNDWISWKSLPMSDRFNNIATILPYFFFI